jgi:pimeloyl-ACP methyl ester carboxylesterase
MRFFLSLTALYATSTAVNALRTTSFAAFESGFHNPIIVSSVGGQAICIQGNIQVTASSNNTLLDFTIPANQTVVTNTIQEFYQIDSNLTNSISRGKVNVSGTYNINSKLCFPASTQVINPKTVQALTHGVGFDKGYWDFYSVHYSYVDAAAAAGFTTFSYDRLGTGLSDHPDPIQVVQAPLHVSILHELIQKLRAGAIANTTFSNVVGVGHSFGSDVTASDTSQYPEDLDAAVLTGYGDSAGQAVFFSGLNLAIAGHNDPTRFDNLSNGFLVPSTIISIQFGFFRTPNFDPLVLAAAETAKQTFTFGELFTKSQLAVSAPNYTGPVIIVDGENDLDKCDGNCLIPPDLLATTLATQFSVAKSSSTSYVAPTTGHGLNLHYTAKPAYAEILKFISAEGL